MYIMQSKQETILKKKIYVKFSLAIISHKLGRICTLISFIPVYKTNLYPCIPVYKTNL